MLLASVSGGVKEAESRVRSLQTKFPKHKFRVVETGSHTQIEFMNLTGGVPKIEIDHMVRIANGSEPVILQPKAAVAKPESKPEAKPAVMEGAAGVTK